MGGEDRGFTYNSTHKRVSRGKDNDDEMNWREGVGGGPPSGHERATGKMAGAAPQSHYYYYYYYCRQV